MTRSEYRKLLWGVGLLGGGSLLLELLSFRLVAATMGHPFALFVGLTAPALAAVGATVLARRAAGKTGAQLERTAAHLTAASGTFAVLGVIGLTLVSQKIARARGEGELWHVGLVLASCWLPALFAGGAMGTVFRRGAAVVGRVAAALAFGGVAASLAAPSLLSFGAPRLAIANGLVFGVAALVFAYAGQAAHPRTAVIWTLPLAVLSLIAGDVGAPWLKMRFDLGRRTRIDHASWSPQGLIAVQKVKRGRTNLQIDRGDPLPLAEELKGQRKPGFKPQDLVYLTSFGEKGPVLVVGSAGGREAAVALAYDHPRVDVAELHGSLVNELLLDRYAEVTGHVLHRQEVITPRVGDGRAGLGQLPRDYQHVVVSGHGAFDQAAPRLLSGHERLFTEEALAVYLDRLRPDGTLLLHAPKAGLAALIAAASAALGLEPSDARDHLLACSGADDVVLLVQLGAREPSRAYNLEKRCKRSRLTIDYPLSESVKRRPQDRAKAEREREEKLARLEAGRAATDDRPYFVSPASWSDLKGQAVDAVRALRPRGDATAKKKPEKGEDRVEEEAPPPKATLTGTAAASVLVALLLLLVGMAVPPPRASGAGRLPWALRLSFPAFGLAMALGLFSLNDQILRVVGDAAYGWSLVIPLGLVGVGAGRLWVDTVAPGRLRLAVALGLQIGMGWLVLVGASHATIAGMVAAGPVFRLAVAPLLILVTGALLGWPLAAGLKVVALRDPAPVTWCWGAHFGGWALGGALAASLVPLLGVSGLPVVAFVSFGLGGVALVVGMRRRVPSSSSPQQTGPPAAARASTTA